MYFDKNDCKNVLRSHMTCQNLVSVAHEEQQGIGFVLEFTNLTNLNDKQGPSRHLTYPTVVV